MPSAGSRRPATRRWSASRGHRPHARTRPGRDEHRFGRQINQSGFPGHSLPTPGDRIVSQHFLHRGACNARSVSKIWGHQTMTAIAQGSMIGCMGSRMPHSMQDLCDPSRIAPGLPCNGRMAEPGDRVPRLAAELPRAGRTPRNHAVRRAGGLAPWQLRRATDMLRANIEANVPVRSVAEACRLSTSHFIRAFKVSTGVSPLQWVIALRISLSRSTLVQSDIPLVDVARMYGFSDQSHFSRVFRNVVGTSPGAWRREYRDERGQSWQRRC